MIVLSSVVGAAIVLGGIATVITGAGPARKSPRSAAPVYTTESPGFAWIHAAADHFADSQGNIVVFRGFVFIANKNGNPYDSSAYAAAKSFGANYQSIKVYAGAAGYGGAPNQGYLDELASMVHLAEQQGMYTDLKMTIYDIPGFDWTAFWRDQHGEQEHYLELWSAIWQRFATDPGVVAFDLLNEPEMGQLALTHAQFQSQYLSPFYEEAITQLRAIDAKHMAFFQPEFEPSIGPMPYPHPPSGLAGTAYAPHFYPSDQSRFVPLIDRFRQEATTAGVPLIIGEYGELWQISDDGNTSLENQYDKLESYAYSLFGQYGLSYSRPWFADDRVTTGNPNKTWSIFSGTTGDLSRYRTWIVDPFKAAAGVTRGDTSPQRPRTRAATRWSRSGGTRPSPGGAHLR